MNGRSIRLILVAALVAIAGCAGGMAGDPVQKPNGGDSGSTLDASGGTGTAAFYVSDEPSQIDDFEHLNVTITKVGFKKAGDAADGSDDGGNESDETESDDGTEDGDEPGDETESENETSAGETKHDDGSDDESDSDAKTSDESEADENEANDGGSGEGDGDGASDERWIEYDVDERTVDLTELKGANASMIDEFELPAGEYETVFIHVSDTEGILADGSETNVKLPSNKLQLHTTFTVGNNESVDFVYDIAPHKAGKSGKYILKPVISQSGTGDDVEIRDIDERNESSDERADEKTKGGETGSPDGNGDATAEVKPAQD